MEEIQTLQQINILGDATLSGQINVINDTNSTSYTTGSIVTAGGIGIAKDVFVNGTLNATKMHLIDPSGTTLGRQYFSNGTIWNIENQVGTGLTKSVDISQTGVTINQTTSASSTTTGALTVAGGISTQDNVWAKGNIVATDASSSTIIMTPSTPFGAVSSIQNGVIINNSSGFVNDESGNLLVGINTKHFGARTETNQGGVMKISTSTSSPLFDFSVLPSSQSTNREVGTTSLILTLPDSIIYNNSTLQPNKFSYSLWVRVGVLAGVDKRIFTVNFFGGAFIVFQAAANTFRFDTDGTRYKNYTPSTAVAPAGIFNHFAVVVDGATMSYYVNNILRSTLTIAPFTDPTLAGTNVGGSGSALTGNMHIDDLRIYNNKALTPSEISSIYNYKGNLINGEQNELNINTDPSLLAYYPFDDTFSGKEFWNYNAYFTNGSITNNVSSIAGTPTVSTMDPTSALTIDQNGVVKVQTTTQSTTTTSGALQVTGGLGVGKNMNVGGTIGVWDGVNSGTISQSGTNLNIVATNINLTGNVSLSGNVQITGNVTLSGTVSGGSSSTSSIFDYKVLDDCILHTHVYNMANPSITKTMLTSSYPLKDYSNNSAIALTQNVLYFYAVRLIQGQTVKGVFFWSNSSNTTVRTGLYSPDGVLKVSLNSNQSITGNNMKYLPLTNATWTVDSTNIYYVGILASAGSSTIYGTAANSYINYGASATSGKLTLAASSIASQSSMPSTLSGLTPTALTQIGYVGVYKDGV